MLSSLHESNRKRRGPRLLSCAIVPLLVGGCVPDVPSSFSETRARNNSGNGAKAPDAGDLSVAPSAVLVGSDDANTTAQPSPPHLSPDASAPLPGTTGLRNGGLGPADSACEFGPFSTPVAIAGLSLNLPVFGPTLSGNGLALFFSAVDGTDENIFQTSRQSLNDPFLAAEPVSELNDPLTLEGTPFLTAGGLALYFFSNRPAPDALGDRDIWVTRRPSTDATFLAPRVVESVNSPGLEHLPWVSEDEKTLVLVADRAAATAGSNLWLSERSTTDVPFPAPIEFPGVNADARDEGPFLSRNGLTLLLASNRSGLASMDLWMALRSSSEEEFGEPQRLVEVSSAGEDIDPTLTSDGTELLFSSNRDGEQQLYRALRSCL